jgi:hypothetical protein
MALNLIQTNVLYLLLITEAYFEFSKGKLESKKHFVTKSYTNGECTPCSFLESKRNFK